MGLIGRIPLIPVPTALRRASLSPLKDLERTREIAWPIEIARTLRRLNPVCRRLLPSFDELKATFDRAATKSMPPAPQIVLGFPASCKETFRRAPAGVLKVLYEVDSHPLAHNRLLERHFPERGATELYSAEYISRITSEIELADVVVIPSRFVLEQFYREGVPPAKLLLRPYGVDASAFAPDLRRASIVEDGPVRLLYVGSVSLRKGIPFLLEAVADLPGIHLDIYGPVVDSSLMHHLPTNVRRHEVIGHDDLKDVFASHDGFVFASIDDACPLAVREALSAGLPVIASDGVGGVEHLPANDVAVVPTGDVQSLRAALSAVQHLNATDRMARAARMRSADGLLDWRDYSADFIESIERLVPLEREDAS